MRYQFTPIRIDTTYLLKKQKIAHVDEDVEKLEVLYNAGGKMVQLLWETERWFLTN